MPVLPPVPDCEGPKLHPYQPDGTPEISFLELIGQGAHGNVFKVQIDGKILALKVFKYQHVDSDWLTMADDEWEKVDTELLTAQWHPFHAECRAYARLKEAKKEDLAIRCYGYLHLTEEQKKEVEDRFGIGSWWDDDYNLFRQDPDPVVQQFFQRESSRPLRATVKDFIHSDVPFGPQHATKMLKDLRQLHRCGIVVWDVKEDAYIDGKLVDFSKAVVSPHMKFDTRLSLRTDLDREARDAVFSDLSGLYVMFKDWNEEHEDGPHITCHPLPTRSRLRGGRLSQEELIARCFNPRVVDWQKFSRRSVGFAAVGAKKATSRNSRTTGRKPNGVLKQKAPTKSKRTRS